MKSSRSEETPEDAYLPRHMTTRSMARADPSLRPTSPTSTHQVESLSSPENPPIDDTLPCQPPLGCAANTSEGPAAAPAQEEKTGARQKPLPRLKGILRVRETDTMHLESTSSRTTNANLMALSSKPGFSHIPYRPPTPPLGQVVDRSRESQWVVPLNLNSPAPARRAENFNIGYRLMDRRYREQVELRRLLVNKREYEESLQTRTLNVLVQFLREAALRREQHGLLTALTGPLLSLVRRSVPEDLLLNCEVQMQMITQFSHEVMLKFSDDEQNNWTQDHIEFLLQLLGECKNKLRSLIVEMDEDAPVCLSVEQVNDIVSQQCNLQELCLRECGINNDTLSIIASTCPNISILDVSCNTLVTDVGLSALSEKCVKLSELNITDTHFSMSCVAQLIHKLPQLTDIQMSESCLCEQQYEDRDYLCVGDAILLLLNKDPSVRLLNLTSLEVHSGDRQVCAQMVQIVPNASRVKLLDCPDILPLLDLKNIEQLKLSLHDNKSIQDLPSIVLRFADKLTHVDIHGQIKRIKLDISLFTVCQKLKILKLRGFEFNCEAQYKMESNSFENIADVCLKSCCYNDSIPDQILTKILTSHSLERFKITSIKIPELLLKSVIQETATNPRVFAKLRYLNMKLVDDPKHFSLDTVLRLVCVLPAGASIEHFYDLLCEYDRKTWKLYEKRNFFNVRRT